jgi:hypothetical protein
MDKHPRFLDLYHAGQVRADAVDEYVADWHDEPIQRVALHTYLGMTWGEYQCWAVTGKLPTEIDHHRVPHSDMVFVAFAEDEAGDLTPLRTHGIVRCRPVCPIHWPSDHPQAEWPRGWDARRGLMTRVCQHAAHHPDPDDQQVRLHPELARHDCDGCCRPTVDGEFFERDEPVGELLAAFDRAPKGITGRPS